jgi:uncharacterized membrane protein YoaK (UPF0700 family)
VSKGGAAPYTRELVAALAGAAGMVDAVSYVALGHVFTANMTGNLVLLGVGVAQGQPVSVLRSTAALVGFVLGMLVDAAVMRRIDPVEEPRRGARHRVGLLGGEAALLAGAAVAVGLLPHDRSTAAGLALTVVAGGAMGLQTAGSRGLRLSGVPTTYVTGTIDKLFGGIPAGEADRAQAPALVLVLVLYVAGAAAGAALLRLSTALPLGLAALVVAVVAAGVGAVEHRRPGALLAADDRD